MTTLEWDEVFDCAVAAWCRSSTSQEMLRMCFQSRAQRNEVSVGWTANELMAFATGIARLVASPTPPAEQQAAPKAAPQQEAQEPVAWLNPWRADQVTTDYDAYGEHGIPLYTAPQPAPAPLSEMPYEKRKAIQEGEQIGASDAWFHARHNMLDTLDRRNVFRAGFDRGWNAALAAQGGE